MFNSQSLSIFWAIICSLFLLLTSCSPENGGEGDSKSNTAHPKLRFYQNRAYALFNTNLDSSIFYVKEGLSYSKENELKKEEAKWLYRLGSYYRYAGLFSVAENYLSQSLEKWKPFNDQKGIAAVYEEMGYNYREMGADDKALKFSRKALEIFETLETLETPKPYKIIDVRIDLGEYFKDRGQFEIAWEEHEEVMKVFESIPDSSESKFYKDRQDRAEELRANIYLESGQINKALPIFKKLNRPNNFTNIGHYYRVSGDDIINKDFQAAQTLYKEAERYHTQSFVHHSTIKNYPRQVLDYWNLGGIHRRLGRFRASIDTLEKGISLAKKHKEGEKLAGMYRTLSDTYHYMGKEDSALLYYRIHKATSDSLNQSRNETITRLSEVHYDTERKEKEKVQAQQETELRSKQLLISLLGFLLVAGLCIFYFYRARSRKIRMEQQAEINSQIVVDLIQEQTIENLNSRIEGQEEERTRIARELHDQLGGTLAAVKFSLEGMENKMPMELIDSYRKTHKLLQSATDNTRTLSHQMKALHLEDLGLDDSLQQFCDALNGNGSLQVHFNRTRIAESHISPKAELQLYRVAQELLQNVIKHAHASEVFLQLTYEEDKLTLMLEDDGQGFDTKKVSSGMGMQNIQNRVAQIDGKLDFDSLIGQGTTVIIEVPTEKD